ncbi:hypothetical protein K1T71_008190 [Dendrolimus kikuchii]|uniref:Uncharacterized protein n=1 Tax=Dendrolimus kikuchii TaxID=765133 RepID=A0ACC1CWQ8_9NEOP|nr:hypothetical protein K1T71_008190 [Dendrolimus kikuchii]
MDVVGSEIGQKMRSAIKAKLTELGCYVDDELPDYVMVMVANKRTRAQMEDDLQLFLGDNTELFVNWLHQVLKKLQEVTVTAPMKPVESDKSKEKLVSKERKIKEKKSKDKAKKSDLKKAKKKEKVKVHKNKEGKRPHKSKKKSKHHEMIRPNVPPLLMNMEKESEPSITDVFAGQILKNHGITIDNIKEDKVVDKKPIVKEKRPILPIIDPSTISSSLEPVVEETNSDSVKACLPIPDEREEQLKEIDDIENKIQGLKQKLVEQLDSIDDSMSDDEDFLTIRTEAEELMNDFAEDVIQEITQQAPVSTPPLQPSKSPSPVQTTPKPIEPPKDPLSDSHKDLEREPHKDSPREYHKSPLRESYKDSSRDSNKDSPRESHKDPPRESHKEPSRASYKDPPKELHKDPSEILPQIELKLPKRPVRERLGAREESKKFQEPKETEKRIESPERFTPEREPEERPQKLAKIRIEGPSDREKRNSSSDEGSGKTDHSSKKLNSRVSVLDSRSSRSTCASVVRVRPRPRMATTTSSLLFKAVADAHKSLLNIPPKVNIEPQQVKRALVLPMRRTIDPQNIVIQVPSADVHDDDNDRRGDSISLSGGDSDSEKMSGTQRESGKEEYIPIPITKRITNTDYVPSRRTEQRTSSRRDDTLIIETINIHNPTVDKDKSTQFIVTMDGFNPNAFLAKKLQSEGLLNDEEKVSKTAANKKTDGTKENSVLKEKQQSTNEENQSLKDKDKQPILKQESEIVTKEKDDFLKEKIVSYKSEKNESKEIQLNTNTIETKRLSNTSDESDTQVIIKDVSESPVPKEIEKPVEKQKSIERVQEESPHPKKRKASPIVFNVEKKDRVERARTESAGSDNHVVVTTTNNTHKYDSLPPLSQAERKLVWCRSFPLCRYGSACAFAHPRCKFAAACTRRNCVYSHAPGALSPTSPAPSVASHVVPAANYKTISASAATNVCKYYPNCANTTCHFYHPKPCRYGKMCANKIECNFYHADVPAKWKYTL